MDRCNVKINSEKIDKKIERMNKIAKEAAEQSHRSKILKVKYPIDFIDMIYLKNNYDLCLYAYENHMNTKTLKEVFSNRSYSKVIILVEMCIRDRTLTIVLLTIWLKNLNAQMAVSYTHLKKVILFDLDNTIASYEEVKPNSKQLMLNEKLTKMGYKIYIISNNRIKRVKEFVETFKVKDYLTLARKPFTKRVCAFIKKNNLNKDEKMCIRDSK